MKRFIEVTKEDKAFLMKAFKVSSVMVYYALYFDEQRGNSELAKKIRTLALKRGGKVMLFVPECETIHTADGIMFQTFENGYQMVCNMKQGRVDVRHGGATLFTRSVKTLQEFEKIQMEVQNNPFSSVR